MPKGAGLTKPMKLSPELADIVGKKEASRAECIKELWAYLKKHNLQDPENKQYFIPDKKMAKVSDIKASARSLDRLSLFVRHLEGFLFFPSALNC